MNRAQVIAGGALALCLLVGISCGSADSGTAVTIRNESGTTVRVVEVGVNNGSDLRSEVQAGGERKTLWHFRDGSAVTLMAEDLGGQLIFCRRYSFDEVRRLSGEVVITEDQRDCS